MMSGLLAASLLYFQPPVPAVVQRVDVRRYVMQYNAAIDPAADAGERMNEIWGDGFDLGSQKAINISAAAQAYRSTCTRSLAALRKVVVPPTVSTTQHAVFESYHGDKVRMWGARCDTARLSVAYVDDPLRPSRRAALERSWKRERVLGDRAGARMRPVFRELGVEYPRDWS